LTVEAHVGFNDIQNPTRRWVYKADSYADLPKVVHKGVKLTPFHEAPGTIGGGIL